MRFIFKKFPLTKNQKIALCLILNMQIKTEKNSLVFGYLKKLEQLTKLLHMDTFKVH